MVAPHKSGMANDQTAPQNEVMNGDEAAVFLKMPKSTLLKLCSEGQLPGVKVGRQWRFNRFALENWMRERDGDATSLPEESVGEPVDFSAKLQKAETTVARKIKPVVEEMVGSVGDDDFDGVGDVREMDEFTGVGEVIEQSEDDEPIATKANARTARKPAARSTSALDLMAEISEKSQGKKSSKPTPAAREPKLRKGVQPAATARQTFHESVRDTSSDSDAVEISRPYNKPGSIPPTLQRRNGDRPSGGLNAFRKLAYWVVILVVLGGAGFGIKELLNPNEPAPSPLAPAKPQPSLPVLPEFQVVYKHNDADELAKESPASAPVAIAPIAAPMPPAVTEAIPTPTAPPAIALEEAPISKTVALTPEAPARPAPVAVAPSVDQSLESINRLLPSLMDMPGCIITSNKNEIRIKFEEGVFASGLKVDKKGREQLARVGAMFAEKAPDFWLIIEGQTDGTAMRQQSPFRDNFTLGLRRAVAATEVLRENGNFPSERLLVSSTGGMTQPFSSDVPNAAARNRTVVLRLVPKTGPVPPSIQ